MRASPPPARRAPLPRHVAGAAPPAWKRSRPDLFRSRIVL